MVAFLLIWGDRGGGGVSCKERFLFSENIYCDLLETGLCFVAQAGLKLAVLLSQPPKCWAHRNIPMPAKMHSHTTVLGSDLDPSSLDCRMETEPKTPQRVVPY